MVFSQVAGANQGGGPVKSGYAPVNGLMMYYEIHGSGEPVIQMHGGVGSTGMFSQIIPALASGRQVIAVDLQAHGQTADIDRPLAYEAMAHDIEMLRKLVLVSTPCKRAGWYPEIQAAMGTFDPEKVEQMKQSPMYQAYVKIAPRPDDGACSSRNSASF